MNRAVFLDRDGTLIENIPFNADPGHVRLMDGAGPSLRKLTEKNFRLIVISNQPGVGLGLFSEQAVHRINATMEEQLVNERVRLDGFYFCPHATNVDNHVTAGCRCRKPEPGLLFQAASDHRIDLHRSWFIGDILDDVEAGNRAGCRTILVDTGGETEWRVLPERKPTYLVRTLEEASNIILAEEAAYAVLA